MNTGKVFEIRYNRRNGKDELTGNVRQHTGEAILESDVSCDILHGTLFVAAVYWYEGLRLPTATYVPDIRVYDKKTDEECYDVPVYHLARVTEINYAHPEGECAPQHTIQLIRPLSCKEVADSIFIDDVGKLSN